MPDNTTTTNPFPTMIKIVNTENKGRSLVSARPLKVGEIILKESPLLLYSATLPNTTNNYCSNCFTTLKPSTQLSCPHCPSRFCTPKCHSLSLTTSHTPFICQSLTALFFNPHSPLIHHSHDIHLQARFLVSAYNLAMISPPQFQTLLSLQGEPGKNDNQTSLFLHNVMSSVIGPLSVGLVGFSLEMTAALLAKDRLNAFGLMEPFSEGGERSVRAYGIYAMASFFNHDCLPNSCRFDYVDSGCDGNTDIVVRMIHDVPEGREVCLSYFPVNVKYAERQRRLREDYGFVCDCDRCKVEANWSDDEDKGEGGMEEEEEKGDEDMDEDEMEEGGEDEGDCSMVRENDDFPHAYFFVRYMCSRENCGGTLAPLPPVDGRSSNVMECNVCGNLSKCEEMV